MSLGHKQQDGPNKKQYSKQCKSEKDTLQLAKKLAQLTYEDPKVFIQLTGPLGAGKTTFARAFIQEWLRHSGENKPENVTSPTYNLVRIYGTSRPLAHLDLFRLETLEELEAVGYERYFYEVQACLVEWLEKIPGFASLRPPETVQIEFEITGEATRKITIQGLKKSI